MIETVYRYWGSNWPSKEDVDQPRNPVIRVRNVQVVGDDGLDVISILEGEDEPEDEPVVLRLEITLEYGCTHKTFPNAGPWGKWYCGERTCSHYLGRKEARR